MTSRDALGPVIVLIGIAFCNFSRADTPDQAAIKDVLNDGCKLWLAGKPEEAIGLYLNSVMVQVVALPRQKNYNQMVQSNQQLSKVTVGIPTCVYEEINPVILTSEYAYSTAILNVGGNLKDGRTYQFRERSTDIWKKVAGRWRVMHEHNSVPVDVFAGTADLESKP